MSFSRELEALDYPRRDGFSPDDPAQLHALAVWLEDSVIRALPIADRGPLRLSPDAVDGYLSDVGFPARLRGASASPRLKARWLIQRALALQFRDHIESASAAAQPLQQQEDVAAAEWKEAAAKLAAALHAEFPADSEAQLRMVAAIERVARRHFGGGLSGSSAEQQQEELSKLASMGTVERAVAVLRLLYAADLRCLQLRINELIDAAQKLTANPKTNTALGLVGW